MSSTNGGNTCRIFIENYNYFNECRLVYKQCHQPMEVTHLGWSAQITMNLPNADRDIYNVINQWL